MNKINNKEVNQLALTSYVDQQDGKQDIAIADKANKDEVLLLNGTKHMTGRLDLNAKKIINIADTFQDGDAINNYRVFNKRDLRSEDWLVVFHLLISL